MSDKSLRPYIIFLLASIVFAASGLLLNYGEYLPSPLSKPFKKEKIKTFGATANIAIATSDIRGRFFSPIVIENNSGSQNLAVGIFDSGGLLNEKHVIIPEAAEKFIRKVDHLVMTPLTHEEDQAIFFSTIDTKNGSGKNILYFAIISENGDVSSYDIIETIQFSNTEDLKDNLLKPVGFEINKNKSGLLYLKGQSLVRKPLPRSAEITGYPYAPENNMANGVKVRAYGPIPKYDAYMHLNHLTNFVFRHPQYHDEIKPCETKPNYELEEGVQKLKPEHKELMVTFMHNKNTTLEIKPNPDSVVIIQGINVYTEE